MPFISNLFVIVSYDSLSFFSQAVSYDYINEEASRLEALSICHMFQKSDISVGFGINYKLY